MIVRFFPPNLAFNLSPFHIYFLSTSSSFPPFPVTVIARVRQASLAWLRTHVRPSSGSCVDRASITARSSSTDSMFFLWQFLLDQIVFGLIGSCELDLILYSILNGLVAFRSLGGAVAIKTGQAFQEKVCHFLFV